MLSAAPWLFKSRQSAAGSTACIRYASLPGTKPSNKPHASGPCSLQQHDKLKRLFAGALLKQNTVHSSMALKLGQGKVNARNMFQVQQQYTTRLSPLTPAQPQSPSALPSHHKTFNKYTTTTHATASPTQEGLTPPARKSLPACTLLLRSTVHHMPHRSRGRHNQLP
jgi:hypothetical protein